MHPPNTNLEPEISPPIYTLQAARWCCALVCIFALQHVYADAQSNAEICHAGTGSLDLDRRVYARAAKSFTGVKRAALLIRKAGAAIWLGRYDEALSDLDSAQALFPQSALAWFERGQANLHLGNFAASRSAFPATIRLWSKFTLAQHARGPAAAI